MLKIGILLGDDIGLEVVPECVKVMQATAGRVGLEVEWQELPIGRRGHELHGHTLPKVTADALETLNGWVLGPIGTAPTRAMTRPGSCLRYASGSSCSPASSR